MLFNLFLFVQIPQFEMQSYKSTFNVLSLRRLLLDTSCSWFGIVDHLVEHMALEYQGIHYLWSPMVALPPFVLVYWSKHCNECTIVLNPLVQRSREFGLHL
jgi:hypothetical protein